VTAALGVGQDEAEARRRAAASRVDFATLRSGTRLVGTVAEIVERLKVYEAMGVSRF